MTIELHCFGESGNAYKAAIAFELTGLDWRPVFVDFFNGETREEEWREANNVMGEVPVMVDGDLRLSQSGAIQQHVVARTGKLGGAPDDALEILRWQFWDNHKFSGKAGATRFMTNFLPREKRSEPVIDYLRKGFQGSLAVLDRHLAQRDWIVGRDVTVADLSCCSYLFYPEPFGFERADWPGIDRWLSAIEALPGWRHPYDLMPRGFADHGGAT